MKRLFALLLCALLVVCAAAASASPCLTDGEHVAWIGGDSAVYLRAPGGNIRQSTFAVSDLLGMSDTEFYCLGQDHYVYALQLDGQSGRLALQNPTEEELAAVSERGFQLEENRLTVGEVVLSETALAADSSGRRICWAEKEGEAIVLKYRDLVIEVQPGEVPAVPADVRIALTGRVVPEPLSLILSRDALTLTAADHSVLVINPETGFCLESAAAQWQTEAAVAAEGQLYRYVRDKDGAWMLETQEQLVGWDNPAASPLIVTPTVTPTPVVTPAPTATRAPTPTPRYTTPKPTATPRGEDPDRREGYIYRGDTGSDVRKMQRRLNDLGYPVGQVDGAWGEQTQIAFNLFCDAIRVREAGYMSPKVKERLMAPDAPYYDPCMPLWKGDQGLSVLYMQRRLSALGYNPGKQDGIYGKNTIAAVALFQADYSIPLADKEVPGEVASRELLTKLYSPDLVPVITNPPPASEWDRDKVLAFVARCYTRGLNRDPDASGQNMWANQIMNGEKTPAQVAKSILSSEEAKKLNLSDESFVRVLYGIFLNRDADESGLAMWIAQLTGGTSRDKLINEFVKSEEVKKALEKMKIQK